MATMTTPVTDTKRIPGGSFLITDPTPADCFFPEDFTDEHKQIAETTANFAINEIMPVSDQIEAKDFPSLVACSKRPQTSASPSVDIPEEYGGLEMDKVTSAIVAENIAKQASFSVAFSAHVGIGTLPLVWYGTPEQKKKYLPKIATGEIISAYALSESTSGSDAVNARTRAVLSADGKTYTLNGEKMWITNAGFADLFTVFAKCAVPKAPMPAREAHRLPRRARHARLHPRQRGAQARHSRQLHLSADSHRLRHPCEQSARRSRQGPSHCLQHPQRRPLQAGQAAVGGGRMALNNGIRYAKERKAFGKSISEFGLIQEKIADCAIGMFVGEALSYRTVGLIDEALAAVDKNDTTEIQKRIEDYAVECSIVKVWAQRDARHGRRRGAADLRRLRLRRGVSRRARLPRLPHQPHL